MSAGAEPEHRSGDRHIVLVGPMGSGKTTVGSAVADRLGVPLVDSDADIVALTGRTAAEFAGENGVAALHALEEHVLAAALAALNRSVVAAAASVVDSPAARRQIARNVCVFLTASPSILRKRHGTSRHRRRVGRGEAETFTRRVEAYTALADVIVDTGRTGVEEATSLIIELIDGHDGRGGSTAHDRGDS